MSYQNIKTMLKDVDKIPYPQVYYVYPNTYFANQLYDSYAGQYGELTATTQYIYQHINISENSTLSDILKHIAIMEMKHLDMIGDLIRKLGSAPHYMNSDNQYWCSFNVNYDMKNLTKTMENNIKAEKTAIAEYSRLSLYTRNPSILRLLQRIILDEKTHIKAFEAIIKELQ